MVSQYMLSVILVFASGSAYVLMENDDPSENIIWPSEYYFNAETIDLKNGFIETFEVWYSAENNRSRVDYYDGTYKEYYLAESDEDTGTLYKVHPITTEEVRNEIVCFTEIHEGEQPDFLPVTANFTFVEQIDLNGKQVHVWRKEMIMEEEDLKAESTVYVYRTDNDFDIPLKKEIKIDDLSKGEVNSHKIINYKRFEYNVYAENVTYADAEDCDMWSPFSMDFKTRLSYLSPHHPHHLEEAFHSYKEHHNKKYLPEEHEMRKEIFHRNWLRVMAHNSKNLGYKMELNKFSDRTAEELKYLTGTRPSDPFVQGSMPFPHSDEELLSLSYELPESYDLRIEGFLSPIKNQGACGSCWAFTTTATVEGMFSKTYGGRNLDLSEQSLVDCAWGFENMGCDGGQLDKAYEYILKHGIPKESDYGPYLRKDGYCNLNNNTETVRIKGFAKVTPQNPTALKVALVKYGPVAVAIHATENMKAYAHGIFYDIYCDDAHPNHGVVVVGYGERDGTPYWIVRNSWGEDFGMDGYILMSQLNNNCMVMDTPFYPIV